MKNYLEEDKMSNATQRHSRFGGSFAMTSMSGKRMVAHQSLASVQNVREVIDSTKNAKKPRIIKQVHDELHFLYRSNDRLTKMSSLTSYE